MILPTLWPKITLIGSRLRKRAAFFRKIWSQSLRLVVVNIIKYVSMPPVRESFYYFKCVRLDCFFLFSWGRIRCICFTIMYYTISSRNSASFFGIGKYLQPYIIFLLSISQEELFISFCFLRVKPSFLNHLQKQYFLINCQKNVSLKLPPSMSGE